MNAKLCDACKKIISEKEIEVPSGHIRRVELCPDCKKKYDSIKERYDKEEQKLEEKYKALNENFKKELKEIGIDYE